MALLSGTRRCYELDHIKYENVTEIFPCPNLNNRLEIYNQRHLERISDSRLVKQAWNYLSVGNKTALAQ